LVDVREGDGATTTGRKQPMDVRASIFVYITTPQDSPP
jgi:hypothetical protein